MFALVVDKSLLESLGGDVRPRGSYRGLHRIEANDLLPEDHWEILCYAYRSLRQKKEETATRILRYLISQMEQPGADDRLLLSTRLLLANAFYPKRQLHNMIQELEAVINMLDTSSEGHWEGQFAFEWDSHYGLVIRNWAWFGKHYLILKRMNNDVLHEISMQAQITLAFVYEDSDQKERARACFERAFSELRGDKENLRDTVFAITALELYQAEIDCDAERFDVAERLLERTNERAGRHLDRNHMRQTVILQWLVAVKLQRGCDREEIKALVAGNRVMEAEVKAEDKGSFLSFCYRTISCLNLILNNRDSS